MMLIFLKLTAVFGQMVIFFYAKQSMGRNSYRVTSLVFFICQSSSLEKAQIKKVGLADESDLAAAVSLISFLQLMNCLNQIHFFVSEIGWWFLGENFQTALKGYGGFFQSLLTFSWNCEVKTLASIYAWQCYRTKKQYCY